MNFRTFVIVIIAIHQSNCETVTGVRDGVYRIENKADKLHLTTEGSNAAFAKVVGENWHNYSEQRWRLEKSVGGGGLYDLTPQKYSSNNVLSFYRDASRKHALPEKWKLIEVTNNTKEKNIFQLQNYRTGQCLISNGRRKEISEGPCDRYLPNRHWRLISL